MKITWLGHAAFLIEGKAKVLVDPFLEGNPKAAKKPDEVDADVICITHAHADHIGDAGSIAKRCGATVVSTYEIVHYLTKKYEIDGVGMNVGGTVEVKGLKITMVPAVHTSGIIENDKVEYGGIATGFVIEIEDGKKVYHAGDTGLTADMQIIGELYKPDVALLPIGGHFTMGIDEAVHAVKMLKPKYVIPMHYGTWPIIEADPAIFKEKAEKAYRYAKVIVLSPGESVEL
ncbi:metal-dependent hydrolase [Methanosarcinales archaeon]|nr:metal-dependent hydrolase [Euryarchaeota archaeon]RLG32584.1 MAG: metal-dependent hydrolase [Methanosarcinales archaeon]